MANDNKPIGEIVLVGRVAFQLFSRTYRGVVYRHARIGKPWSNKNTGETHIIPHMMDDCTRDFKDACELAAQQLEEFRNAAFREKVQKNAASISPIVPATDNEIESATPRELKLANG